jgi:glycosyltransferase A (GT-A) superfamily protein (DUF2064 family)
MDTRFGVPSPSPSPPLADAADAPDSALAAQVIVLIDEQVTQAALRATLGAATAAPVARRVLVTEARPDDRPPAGFEIIGQRGADAAERMSAAFADAYATIPLPVLLVAVATPEVTADLLADAAHALLSGEADAVFGPLADGGCWLLGLCRPDRSLLVGAPGSSLGTGRRLLERLAAAGLRVALAPRLAAPAKLRF